MEVEEAAQAAGDIEPKVALPMHWGAGAERFRRLI